MTCKYPSKPTIVRMLCLKRDNYTCQRCGEWLDDKDLEVHHIDKRKKRAMVNNLSNVITYCPRCHRRKHAEYRDYVPPMVKWRVKHKARACTGQAYSRPSGILSYLLEQERVGTNA